MALSKFVRTLGVSDFGITANVVAQPSTWNTIGTYTVLAQQQATFGANSPTGGASASGRAVYMRFDGTDGVQLHAKVRFRLSNAQETKTITVMEEHTRRLSADSSGDITKSVLLSEYPYKAKEDSLLQIQVYPDSDSAITLDYDGTNTIFMIPVTIWQ